MVSNDVEALGVGDSCDALLLTPKARVVAPLRLIRRADDDFLLLTEPELAGTVRDHLLRSRFAARVEIEVEEHTSHVVLGDRPDGLAARDDDYGEPGWEAVDAEPDSEVELLSDAELETLRIRAATPRYGREIDDRVLPAEAGLVERAVSLTKGCYPGQEPIARLHYRGHANRSLRVLSIASTEVPEPDAELRLEGKAVGRVTSAVPENGAVLALAYVRTEVPADAVLEVGGAEARPLH
jgi:folate-binding protein YgfZ